jgi:hypothetical protein
MSALKTSYEFTLPRGYVDGSGRVHRTGTMRLATARDELDPLRDPTVTGPDDPRLTILVLTRVVDRLGDLELVTSHDIEGLFAVDLAFLQDFYGVINFGSKEEYDELIRSQQQTSLLGDTDPAPSQSDAAQPAQSAPSAQTQEDPGTDPARPALRTAVEEFSRQTP